MIHRGTDLHDVWAGFGNPAIEASWAQYIYNGERASQESYASFTAEGCCIARLTYQSGWVWGANYADSAKAADPLVVVHALFCLILGATSRDWPRFTATYRDTAGRSPTGEVFGFLDWP